MISLLGYTLFPHPADWGTAPRHTQRWQTGVVASLTGAEQRGALRALPLHTLTFLVTPASIGERARLDARLTQSLKSGYGCAPFFGCASVLAAGAGAGSNSLALPDAVTHWPWAAGDYAILLGADDTVFDVLPVTAVTGAVLTLGGILTNSWPAPYLVRPLLFGKVIADKSALPDANISSVKITIQQLVAERNAQLGFAAAPAPGVGQQKIGSTNILQ